MTILRFQSYRIPPARQLWDNEMDEKFLLEKLYKGLWISFVAWERPVRTFGLLGYQSLSTYLGEWNQMCLWFLRHPSSSTDHWELLPVSGALWSDIQAAYSKVSGPRNDNREFTAAASGWAIIDNNLCLEDWSVIVDIFRTGSDHRSQRRRPELSSY